MGLAAGDQNCPVGGLQPNSSGAFCDYFPSKLEMVKKKPSDHKTKQNKTFWCKQFQ